MNASSLLKSLLGASVALTMATGLAAAERVTFTPKELDAIVANPHMGWQTFMRAAKDDKRLPAWIPSTVEYYRFRWADLEPRRGETNWAFVEKTISAAAASGQTIGIRVMAMGDSARSPYHPAWLKEIPDAVHDTQYKDGPLQVPDLDHPVVLESQLRIIAELGKRLDGDPRLDHVDIGHIGFWGEWHMSGQRPVLKVPMPKPETCRRIVDAYFAAFRTTPLVMLIGGRDHLEYAVQKGAGWRADCFGDMGGVRPEWGHMRNSYPERFVQAHLQDAWKHAPIAYESCWDMRKWVASGWDLRYIFNYGLATHASYLNNKSAPLPEGEHVRPELERFLKRLGYRIVVREVEIEGAASTLTIRSTWQNTGSAPCYRPYRVAWRVRGAGIDRVTKTETAISQWMPGHIEVFTGELLKEIPDLPEGPRQTITHSLAGLPPGSYAIAVAVVDDAGKPVINLAIEGKQADGWYSVGNYTVR